MFGDWLGIAHFEYAAVIHRLPVDRRLRDQIAYKLGVAWQAIAEFMPEPPRLDELVPSQLSAMLPRMPCISCFELKRLAWNAVHAA